MKKIVKQIAGVVMALVLGVSLSGCGSSGADKVVENSLKDMQSSLKNIGKELKDGKDETLSKIPGLGAAATYYKGNTEAIKVLGEFSELMGEFEYKIGDIKTDGDNATVKVTFTTYDFGSGMKNAIEKTTADATALAKKGKTTIEIQKELLSQMFKYIVADAKENGKKLSNDIELKLTKTNGEWKLNPSSLTDITNATLGNLQQATGIR